MEQLQAIAKRLEEVLGEPLSGTLRRLSSGASRETFALSTASHGDLIAQLDPAAAGREQRPSQAPLLEAAADAGVPVARVVARGSGDRVLGASWTVLEALSGTSDPARILAAEGVPQPAQLIDSVAAGAADRRLRAPRGRRGRRRGARLVGAARHAPLGGDLRDAGLQPPLWRAALDRARGHRPAGVRGRVGPARAARSAERGRLARDRPGARSPTRAGHPNGPCARSPASAAAAR